MGDIAYSDRMANRRSARAMKIAVIALLVALAAISIEAIALGATA